MADNDLHDDLARPVELPDGGAPHTPYYPQVPKRSSGKKYIVIILVILVLLAAGVGGWVVWQRQSKSTPRQPTTQNQAAQSSTNSNVSESAPAKTFKSDDLALQLSYPGDWKVSEANDGLTLTSPSLTYQSLANGSTQGTFRLYIRQGARPVDGKYIGAGLAIEPSTKLTYTAPGPSQRKDTNVTKFGAVESSHFTFFMVTGDYSLQKDGQLGSSYGHEAETYIIVGGYSTKDQKDDLNFGDVPLNKYQTKTYDQAINIVKSLKV